MRRSRVLVQSSVISLFASFACLPPDDPGGGAHEVRLLSIVHDKLEPRCFEVDVAVASARLASLGDGEVVAIDATLTLAHAEWIGGGDPPSIAARQVIPLHPLDDGPNPEVAVRLRACFASDAPLPSGPFQLTGRVSATRPDTGVELAFADVAPPATAIDMTAPALQIELRHSYREGAPSDCPDDLDDVWQIETKEQLRDEIVSGPPYLVKSSRPSLRATWSDDPGGTGVDPTSLRVSLDDEVDLTPSTSITAAADGFEAEFDATAEWPSGDHRLVVRIADRAGNERRAEYAVTVAPSRPLLFVEAPELDSTLTPSDLETPWNEPIEIRADAAAPLETYSIALNGTAQPASYDPDRRLVTATLDPRALIELRDAADKKGVFARFDATTESGQTACAWTRFDVTDVPDLHAAVAERDALAALLPPLPGPIVFPPLVGELGELDDLFIRASALALRSYLHRSTALPDDRVGWTPDEIATLVDVVPIPDVWTAFVSLPETTMEQRFDKARRIRDLVTLLDWALLPDDQTWESRGRAYSAQPLADTRDDNLLRAAVIEAGDDAAAASVVCDGSPDPWVTAPCWQLNSSYYYDVYGNHGFNTYWIAGATKYEMWAEREVVRRETSIDVGRYHSPALPRIQSAAMLYAYGDFIPLPVSAGATIGGGGVIDSAWYLPQWIHEHWIPEANPQPLDYTFDVQGAADMPLVFSLPRDRIESAFACHASGCRGVAVAEADPGASVQLAGMSLLELQTLRLAQRTDNAYPFVDTGEPFPPELDNFCCRRLDPTWKGLAIKPAFRHLPSPLLSPAADFEVPADRDSIRFAMVFPIVANDGTDSEFVEDASEVEFTLHRTPPGGTTETTTHTVTVVDGMAILDVPLSGGGPGCGRRCAGTVYRAEGRIVSLARAPVATPFSYVGELVRSGEARIVPGAPSDVSLAVDGDVAELCADRMSTFELTMTATDAHENAIDRPGIPVSWARREGFGAFVYRDSLTRVDGTAKAMVRVEERAGPLTILVRSGDAFAERTVTLQAPSIALSLSATAPLAICRGNDVRIHASVTCGSGRPAEGAEVVFFSSLGTLIADRHDEHEPNIGLIVDGAASAVLHTRLFDPASGRAPEPPSEKTGTAFVTAQVAATRAEVTIELVPPSDQQVGVASHSTIVGDAVEPGVVTVEDPEGNPIDIPFPTRATLDVWGPPGGRVAIETWGHTLPVWWARMERHLTLVPGEVGALDDGTGLHPGALTGAARSTRGVVGNAYAFDGQGGATVPDAADLQIAEGLHVGLYARLDRRGAATLIRKGSAWSVIIDEDGRVRFRVATQAGDVSVASVQPLRPGLWHHVTATFAAGRATLTLDRTITRAPAAASMIAPVGELAIAEGLVGALDEMELGALDRVLVTLEGAPDGVVQLDDEGKATVTVASTGLLPIGHHRVVTFAVHGSPLVDCAQFTRVAVVDKGVWGHVVSFFRGFAVGGEDGAAGIAGDILAGIFVWGDIRDLVKYAISITVSNPDGIDHLIGLFALVGVATTLAPPLDPFVAAGKIVLKIIKALQIDKLIRAGVRVAGDFLKNARRGRIDEAISDGRLFQWFLRRCALPGFAAADLCPESRIFGALAESSDSAGFKRVMDGIAAASDDDVIVEASQKFVTDQLDHAFTQYGDEVGEQMARVLAHSLDGVKHRSRAELRARLTKIEDMLKPPALDGLALTLRRLIPDAADEAAKRSAGDLVGDIVRNSHDQLSGQGADQVFRWLGRVVDGSSPADLPPGTFASWIGPLKEANPSNFKGAVAELRIADEALTAGRRVFLAQRDELGRLMIDVITPLGGKRGFLGNEVKAAKEWRHGKFVDQIENHLKRHRDAGQPLERVQHTSFLTKSPSETVLDDKIARKLCGVWCAWRTSLTAIEVICHTFTAASGLAGSTMDADALATAATSELEDSCELFVDGDLVMEVTPEGAVTTCREICPP